MSSLRYWIVGAGGFGREVLSYIEQSPNLLKYGSIAGFLDDDLEKRLPNDIGYNIGHSITGYYPEDNDRFFLAIGNPRIKEPIYANLKRKGAQFETLVHPTAMIGPRVEVGEGCIICPRVVLTCDISIGKFVLINCLTTLGHDVSVGDYTTISGHCDLTGGVTIGKSAFLASHASISPLKHIGDFGHVGPGASVIQDVRPNQMVFGVPALPFKG